MRLHRYFGSHFVETLKEKALYVAKPSSFNDPFELFYRYVENWKPSLIRYYFDRGNFDQPLTDAFKATFSRKPTRREFSRYKKQMLAKSLHQHQQGNFTGPTADIELCHSLADEAWRICCFTETNIKPTDEILLWSHYASKHQGIRIEFEIPYDASQSGYLLESIDYSHERVPIDSSNLDFEGSITRSLRKAITTKSTAWSYENEVRLVVPAKLTTLMATPAGELSFIGFDPQWVTSVDFGLRCPQVDIDKTLETIRSLYPHATARKAAYHSDNFELNYLPIQF